MENATGNKKRTKPILFHKIKQNQKPHSHHTMGVNKIIYFIFFIENSN